MAAKKSPPDSIDPAQAIALLKSAARPAHRAGLARYGIPDAHALGVPMRDIQALGKRIGRQPALDIKSPLVLADFGPAADHLGRIVLVEHAHAARPAL